MRKAESNYALPNMFAWICDMHKARNSDKHSIQPPNLQLGSTQRVGKCLTWHLGKVLSNSSETTQKLFQKLAYMVKKQYIC